MGLIDMAMRSYEKVLPQDDLDRLAFFKVLLTVLDEAVEKGDAAWELAEDEVLRAVEEGNPLFAVHPAQVSADALTRASEALVAAIGEQGVYPDDVMAALSAVSFAKGIVDADVASAGAHPGEFLDAFAQALLDEGAREDVAVLAATIVSLALRQALEAQAQAAFSALESADAAHARFLRCPVCGGEPALSHVGAPTSSAGRGRKLVCLQCATSWEFDRIRCACCGTRNQQSLHLYSIEGDEAHRLAVCDECGGRMKTLYSDDMLAACSYEVENVVMAKLDMVDLSDIEK